ncbi:hypothetical protein H206_03094 [Candidatus Electrothrix aarhusensis]|uniref:Uncharacterized protein n=1 Tax=Candidatus Electrothrix aarhusensis TaxID=1859131 RepID=A0A444IZX6_9BACT|nr:hypothetical protein H206_03094 [Candidatus Electrothrix aarhusensis]
MHTRVCESKILENFMLNVNTVNNIITFHSSFFQSINHYSMVMLWIIKKQIRIVSMN